MTHPRVDEPFVFLHPYNKCEGLISRLRLGCLRHVQAALLQLLPGKPWSPAVNWVGISCHHRDTTGTFIGKWESGRGVDFGLVPRK